jgi:hypothetical protein
MPKDKVEISRRDLEPVNEDRKKWTEADQILAFIKGDVEALPQKLKYKYERCAKIFVLMSPPNNFNIRQTIARMQSLPDYLRVSYGQLCRDIDDAQRIYGQLFHVNRKFEQNFLMEISRVAIQKAVASNNPKLIIEAALAHHKIAGLDNADEDALDFKKLAATSSVTLNIDKAVFVQLEQLASNGVVDMDKLIQLPSGGK